jgi:hypothetical protein
LSWQYSLSTTNTISEVLLFCVCVCVMHLRISIYRSIYLSRQGRQCDGRTVAQLHAACGGQRPGVAPAAARPAATTHDTPRANNNRMAGRQMSCRQQTAPPPCDAAKMSPSISSCPETVLAVHAPSPPAAGSHARPEKTQLPIAEQNRASLGFSA